MNEEQTREVLFAQAEEQTVVEALQDVVDKQAAVIEGLNRSVDSYLRIVEAQQKMIAIYEKQVAELKGDRT